MEFAEGSQGIEQHCRSEPVRKLVWESPSNSRYLIVIQNISFDPFSGIGLYVIEKWCFYPGDCHTSVRYFIAMTGNSPNTNLSLCCVKPICINEDFRASHPGGADFCSRLPTCVPPP